MPGAMISASLDDAGVQRALGRLVALLEQPAPLLRQIGQGLVEATHDRFLTGTDPWGRAWTPLSPAYAALKHNTQILVESHHLWDSINFQLGAREVAVGTNLVYGAIHQFGGTIRPTGGKALAFRLMGAKGPHLVLARSVFIPARPYLGIGPDAAEAIELAVRIQLNHALRG